MEQNQNHIRLSAESPGRADLEWEKIRNEFASNEESISQTEDVITIIKKWIWIQYEAEFKQYEQQLKQKAGVNPTLEQTITQIVEQEKQAPWIINQKYSMQQVNSLIVKLRASIQEILKPQPNLNPQTHLHQKGKEKDSIAVIGSADIRKQAEKTLLIDLSSTLPEIKPKGRIYNPKQLAPNFFIMKETDEDYSIRTPYMLEGGSRKKQAPKTSNLGSKYLKMAFKQLCKQGYNPKGLFQDFSNEADKMTLNKWMVFCKQFSFTDKFSKKQLASLYQNATNFSSTMLLENFLTAISILQQRYVEKFHIGESDFTVDILRIGNQAAFRAKMDNLKVNYSGPRTNFFEGATYLENERVEELQKERVYQLKKREREIVLIKGMLQEQLRDEVQQLKIKREQKKANRMGNSLNMIPTKKNIKDQTFSPVKSTRISDINYSKQFQINRDQIFQKESKTTTTNTRISDHNTYQTELAKNDLNSKVKHKRIEAKTVQNSHPRTVQPFIANKRAQQNQQGDSLWLTKIRTDSQQSDEILREHLKIEKKVANSKHLDRAGDLMRLIEKNSKNVQIRQSMGKCKQEERGLLQTGVNFKKEREGMFA